MALEAPEWRQIPWNFPGGDECNSQRPAVVDWMRSLGLAPERLADRAAVVQDGSGRCFLHVDEIYKVAHDSAVGHSGPDMADPLDMTRLLMRRHIVEVEPNSWPAEVA